MKKIYTSNIPNLVSNQLNFINSSILSDDISLVFENEIELASYKIRIFKAKGIPIIGGARFNKIEQSLILKRFKINHPKSFFTRNYECISKIEELDSYVDLDEFVVKPVIGARGIGVKKITRKEFKDCLKDKNNITKVFKEEKEYLEKNNDCSSSYIENNFNNMLIQEPINVAREFRLILFQSDNSLVYERVKKDKTQFCGNLSHGTTATKVSNETIKKYITPIKSKFYDIMNEFNYPYLSIDLYVDKNNKVGCFEFQMEFAYEGFHYKDVRQYMLESFKYYL